MRIDRNAGDLHLDGTSTETSRYKPLFPSAIAERLLSLGPVGPDSLIGYLKTNYYSKCNDGSSIEGKDATNR